MIDLVFLDANVFNVLKYVVMSLTISFAADILLDTISSYSMAKRLLSRGWARPQASSVQVRFRRGVRLRKAFGSITVFVTVISVSVLEMALEFSTGAESVWIRRTELVRVSKQAANVNSLLQSDANYILKMRFALERVENTCYSVDGMWYFPIIFNMTSATEFHGLGKAALCPSNFSERNFIVEDLQRSSFLAEEVAATNIWNMSELRVGRDTFQSEEAFPFRENPDVRIGSAEHFSFLAGNFSRKFRVEGTERPLTGFSEDERPRAFHTANFTLESGKTIECLMKTRWDRDKETGELDLDGVTTEVCLIPIAGERLVLGLFDDIENGDGFQLVMSVALRNVKSFRDLDVLRFLPWMVGKNDGLHTYRELGILAVLSGRMVRNISVDGYQDVLIEVGSENITVPTLTVWGIVLLALGTILAVIAKVLLSISRRKLRLKGNLGTVRGVAEHWLRQNEDFEDVHRGGGPAVFVLEGCGENVPGVPREIIPEGFAVNVRREQDVRTKADVFGSPV